MKKIEISLSAAQWGVVKFALRRVIDDEGGPLALLWIKGPYKKLHRQLIRTDVSINKQIKKRAGKE